MKFGFRITLTYIITSIVIYGCGNGSSNATNSNNLSTPTIVPIEASPITIDNTGIVPIVNKNPTSSVVYVHNNTDHEISNVTYDTLFNNNSESSNPPFIDPNSAINCQNIAAHGECPLGFTTPALSDYATQGSTIITAHYKNNGTSKSFSQIINYEYVNSTTDTGVQVIPGTKIDGFGNQTGYATIYAYGSGNQQDYAIKSISPSLNSTRIINGNIVGSTLQSGFVQAIELSSNIANEQSFINSLNIQSTSPQGQIFNNNSNLSIVNELDAPKLIIGLTSVLDTSSLRSGEIAVINFGNQPIENISVQTSSGINANTMTCQRIDANSGCRIVYTVPQQTGNGTITITGSANGIPVSASQTIMWFNSQNGPLLSMKIPNSLTFKAISDGTTESIQITNLGGFDIENLDVSTIQTKSGFAKATITSDSCSGITLTARIGTCSYNINVSDNQIENGMIYLYIKGKYKTSESKYGDYSRVGALNYTSLANNPAITFTTLSDMQISGDNIDDDIQNVTITNNGSADALVSSLSLVNNATAPNNLTIMDPQNCTEQAITANGGHCTIKLKLGPQANTGATSLVNSALISLKYSGGTAKDVSISSNNFNATVAPHGVRLAISSVDAQNNDSGDGSQTTPYVFSGANSSTNKTVTITYKNNSTDPLLINSFNTDTLSPELWIIDSNNCINRTLAIVPPNNTCQVTFKNLFVQNIQAFENIGAIFEMNLALPSIAATDTTTSLQYNLRPHYNNDDTIYVDNHQATIVNSTERVRNNFVILHNLANAEQYVNGSIKVQAHSGNFFDSFEPNAECSVVNNVDNTVTQSCGFNNIQAGNENLSVTYTIDNLLTNYFSIDSTFQASTSTVGTTVAMSPNEISTMVAPMYWITLFQHSIVHSLDSLDPSIAISRDNFIYVSQTEAGGHNSAGEVLNMTGGGISSEGWIDDTNPAYNLSLAINAQNEPVVAFRNKDGYILVRRQTHMTAPFDWWAWVGVGPIITLGSSPSISITPQGVIYVALLDLDDGHKAKLLKYDSTNNAWVTIGNPFAIGSISNIHLVTDSNGTPYISYINNTKNIGAIIKFDGTNWIQLGNDFALGSDLNLSLSLSPSNTPYIAYADSTNGNKANVMKFNGTTWEIVGNAGFSLSSVSLPTIAIDNDGIPYVAYNDYSDEEGDVTVMKFYKNRWISVGMPAFTTYYANYISLAINPVTNIPYIAISMGPDYFLYVACLGPRNN